MTKVVLILAFFMSGCIYTNGNVVKTIGNNQHCVECIADKSYCFEGAKDFCRGNFRILKDEAMKLVISCEMNN